MDEIEKQLNGILSRRAAPPPAPGLEARIIATAHPRPYRAPAADRPMDWASVFMRNFLLPRPALALASVAVIGLALGVYTQNIYTNDQDEDTMIIYIDEVFEMGDIL